MTIIVDIPEKYHSSRYRTLIFQLLAEMGVASANTVASFSNHMSNGKFEYYLQKVVFQNETDAITFKIRLSGYLDQFE